MLNKLKVPKIEYEGAQRLDTLKILDGLEHGTLEIAEEDETPKLGEVANKVGASSLQAIANTAAKVKDFAKSSVAKVNKMPEMTKQQQINDLKSKVREDPKTIVSILKNAAGKAGLGVAAAGLGIVALPLLVPAAIGYGIHKKKLSKDTIRSLKDEITTIDANIEKADRENDIDKKADLLIAKRHAERAYEKLKYGLSYKD